MLLGEKVFQVSLLAIIVLVGGLFVMSTVLAQVPPEYPPEDPNVNNLVVEFNPNPLFSVSNFLPGDSVFSYATVSNNSGESKPIAIEAINVINDNVGTDGKFGDRLTLIIKEIGKTENCFNGTLTEFFAEGEFLLCEPDLLNNGESTTYNFFVSFDESSDNNYQGKSLGFDVLIGFQGEENLSDGGGDGGLPDGLIIKDVKAYDITKNSAKVKWWTSYNATSQVVYCEESESCSLDLNDNVGTPPLYGYNYTTGEEHSPADENGVTYREIIITDLQEDITYDFRCISHASPPTVSRNHSFTTLATRADEDNGEDGFMQENEVDNKGIGSPTRVRLPNRQEGRTDGSDPEKAGLIPSVNKVFNSANNFIGSVLGEASTTNESNICSGMTLDNKTRDSFKGSYTQVCLLAFLFFLLIAILLRYISRFKIERKKTY